MSADRRDLLWRNAGTIVLFLALIGSLCTNVLLFHRYEGVTRPAIVRAGVQAGSVLRPFAILDEDGRKSQLEFSGSRPTVIYILAPACGWCKRNQANITALAQRKSQEYKFVGLSTTGDQLRQFWKGAALPFPVYSVASAKVLSDYHFSDETPQMAVVSSEGRVEKAWHGALMGSDLSGAEKFFGVKLPGLITAAAPQGASTSPPGQAAR